jgi:hypothetical protein
MPFVHESMNRSRIRLSADSIKGIGEIWNFKSSFQSRLSVVDYRGPARQCPPIAGQVVRLGQLDLARARKRAGTGP